MNIALYLILLTESMRNQYTAVVVRQPILLGNLVNDLCKDFGYRLFGAAGALIYSLTIAASAMGAVNANIFATAALCVAASKQEYFPRVLANLHYSDGEDETSYYRHAFQNYPSPI